MSTGSSDGSSEPGIAEELAGLASTVANVGEVGEVGEANSL